MPRYYDAYLAGPYDYPVILSGAKVAETFDRATLEEASFGAVSSVPDPMTFNAIRFWRWKDKSVMDVRIAPGKSRDYDHSIKFRGGWNDKVLGIYLPAGMSITVYQDRRKKNDKPSGRHHTFVGPKLIWSPQDITGFGISAATASNRIAQYKAGKLAEAQELAEYEAAMAEALAQREEAKAALTGVKKSLAATTAEEAQAEGEFQARMTEVALAQHQADLNTASAKEQAEKRQQEADAAAERLAAMQAQIDMQKQQAIAMKQAQAEVNAVTGQTAPRGIIPGMSNTTLMIAGGVVVLGLGLVGVMRAMK